MEEGRETPARCFLLPSFISCKLYVSVFSYCNDFYYVIITSVWALAEASRYRGKEKGGWSCIHDRDEGWAGEFVYIRYE